MMMMCRDHRQEHKNKIIIKVIMVSSDATNKSSFHLFSYE